MKAAPFEAGRVSVYHVAPDCRDQDVVTETTLHHSVPDVDGFNYPGFPALNDGEMVGA